ncbi:hypothetical protein NEUTE1DRAFT_75300 [Neurospora tetrasperma FGSC 2508]|uniref:Uncharacterized protein n=1 Tax=Neurospora tetrasperma (strain FGSC 2508 / ATCC MYA-4615 / P0657) TaxID=510951 RepID=F8MBS9_NEUT8|nr:uncharacterized protein NEUTE1DRAFT_75300 [Neurospora tetrasperma FGSC 2508]EGO60337.1 hypothetical protein NEUTE1DRAFT_75300 [Neurospora tetrasperma FGSC 2508]EGZ75688.1 hypothetical protein NEUTE2DRAFT_84380 [Neurospora tetrasperma FGSC 2509]
MCDFDEFVFTCGHSTFRLKAYCHRARNDPYKEWHKRRQRHKECTWETSKGSKVRGTSRGIKSSISSTRGT